MFGLAIRAGRGLSGLARLHPPGIKDSTVQPAYLRHIYLTAEDAVIAAQLDRILFPAAFLNAMAQNIFTCSSNCPPTVPLRTDSSGSSLSGETHSSAQPYPALRTGKCLPKSLRALVDRGVVVHMIRSRSMEGGSTAQGDHCLLCKRPKRPQSGTTVMCRADTRESQLRPEYERFKSACNVVFMAATA